MSLIITIDSVLMRGSWKSGRGRVFIYLQIELGGAKSENDNGRVPRCGEGAGINCSDLGEVDYCYVNEGQSTCNEK